MSLPHPTRTYPLLALLVIILAWLPRGRALDRFATIDEAKWMLRSANFYQALAHGDWSNTYQREHPGVMVTWAGTAGFLVRFRDYAAQAPGQMPGPTRLMRFFRQQDARPAEILAAGRWFMVAGVVLALGLACWLAARLVGFGVAAVGFLLIAFDPFDIAYSRILHLDGLVSAWMLLALLAFLCYLYLGRRRSDLLLSGLAAGIAWLTKSPALFLAPFLGLWVLVDAVRAEGSLKALRPERWWHLARPMLAWFGIAAAVFVLLWPAMWVNPLGTLGRVFSEAFTYTAEGKQSAIFFNGQIFEGGIDAWFFYPAALAWRATPMVLAGLLLALVGWTGRKPLRIPSQELRLAGSLTLFAALFMLFMTLGSQKYDRYLLPAYLPLVLVAGWGWWLLLRGLGQAAGRRAAWLKWATIGAAGAALMFGQAWGVQQTDPYYFTYYNPLLGGTQKAQQVWMLGWGEGLDQAARYLNRQPQVGRLRVVSWYGDACFSYFFKGNTIGMEEDVSLDELKQADYVVIYAQQYQRRLPSPEVLDYFRQQQPEFTVNLNGVDYVKVYKVNKE